jgi:hypothetical protein
LNPENSTLKKWSKNDTHGCDDSEKVGNSAVAEKEQEMRQVRRGM